MVLTGAQHNAILAPAQLPQTKRLFCGCTTLKCMSAYQNLAGIQVYVRLACQPREISASGTGRLGFTLTALSRLGRRPRGLGWLAFSRRFRADKLLHRRCRFHPLEYGHLGSVTLALAQPDNTSVTTVPFLVCGRDLLEKHAHSFFVLV